MNKIRSRIARIGLACVATLGLVVVAATPALAAGSTWSGEFDPEAVRPATITPAGGRE